MDTMKKILFIVGLLIPLGLSAQTISGKVTNDNDEPLFGVNVYWQGTTTVVSTNEDGSFEISSKNIHNKKLIASFVGHLADTLDAAGKNSVNFKLRTKKSLDEVVVTGQRNGVMISDLKPLKVEQITPTELKKSACCDLAGCFETQNTVQPQTTNIITNSKELRILGLSGVYNQILIDGLPLIQGSTYTYGISSIPGSMVDNIHISKGANSVLQGFESISGQINVETKEPDHADKLFLNAYINSYSEKHFNAQYAIRKGKWANLTAFHTVQPSDKIDKDDDTFLDLPLLTRYSLTNKWKYGNAAKWGWNSRIGIRLLNENRIGGQVNYDSDVDKGSSSIYGQSVSINQPEIWTKTGYRFNNKHNIAFYSSALYHDQKSFFGTVNYKANQLAYYSNLQYELRYSHHTLVTGASFRYLTITEDIAFTDTFLHRTYAGEYKREEIIPGLFAENTVHLFNERLTWIAGIRGDNHNEFGFIVTPRMLFKFDIAPQTILRTSIGTGWRTVNLFSENIGLLASSRDIVLLEELKPEKAVNMGINFTQKFNNKSGNFSGYFSADYYRTDFQNQISPDYDSDPLKAFVENFEGKGISNGFQAELNLKIMKWYEIKFGYNFLDVFNEKEGVKTTLPFNPKHKFLTTFSFKSPSNRVYFDINMHWFGEQRLPNTQANPEEYRRPDFSRPYTIVNTQLTYNFNHFEIYTGCENIFNFKQEQPIISWQNPFSRYFDTSSAWGPTRGRELYLGVRFKIK